MTRRNIRTSSHASRWVDGENCTKSPEQPSSSRLTQPPTSPGARFLSTVDGPLSEDLKRDTKQTKNNETNENVLGFSFVSLFFVCFVSLFTASAPFHSSDL